MAKASGAHKKNSKRLSTKKRTKIERKVREHNKKKRKAAKKNPSTFNKKKDVNVPNSCPFKDQILTEAEAHKRRLEEERERQKENRKREREKVMNKKRSLDHLVKDAQRRAADFNRKNEFVEAQSQNYTGGKAVEISLKQYYREFRKVVEAADVVLQVLDARDPLGSRCPQVEEAVLNSGPNKRLVLLLNKVDLVPRENVEEWLKYLRNEFPTIAFKASTQSQNDRLSRSKVPLTLASDDLRRSSRCLGAEVLLTLLGNYCRHKDIRTSISVGIVGFPNTGKSSIINSLKRSKACNIGATPGVTKCMQRVQLDKHVQLLDSPGIVMAAGSSDSATILKNCVKVETIDDPVPVVDAILRRCSKQKIMLQYGLPDFSDANNFLALLAKKQGRLKKGGLPDHVKAGKMVIQDWNQGRITYYTHPPENRSAETHVNAQILSEMSKEFDMDSLLKEEEETLKTLKKSSTNDVVMDSEGPTIGVLDDNAAEEEEDMEQEEMKEEEDEAEQFTVKVSGAKKDSISATKKANPEHKSESTFEGNQQVNKAKKQAFKKMKKLKKKSDKVVGELADVMEGAFDNMDDSDSNDDAYDFATDYA